MITREKFDELFESTRSDVDFATAISDSIISDKAIELDSIMRDIQNNVVYADNPADSTIEYYLMQLTNALYFINTKIEYFGFYEDITKANAKLKYNESYTEKQMLNVQSNTKGTVADLQMHADLSSVDEQMLNVIYSRTVRILNSKVRAAEEMIKTLSKILTVHMNESYATRSARSLTE